MASGAEGWFQYSSTSRLYWISFSFSCATGARRFEGSAEGRGEGQGAEQVEDPFSDCQEV